MNEASAIWNWYTEEQAEKLKSSVIDVRCKSVELVRAYHQHSFKNDKARDYASYGFFRRLFLMRHCMERVFSVLPPELIQPPGQLELYDATAFLHAFTINLSGSVDNLAHVWVQERNVTGKKGRLSDREVGLSPRNNKEVVSSLTGELREYVTGNDFRQWYDCYLKPWRNPLVHRIPFYILPHVNVGDESKRVVSFAPLASGHGGGAEQTMLSFHPQMVADLKTVTEVASILLKELRDQG